jgi:hypothetical protein
MPLTYARKTVRDIYVTVYRERVKKITKFTKSTYPSFVAYRCTVPFSQRKSVSAPPCNLCPRSKVNHCQIFNAAILLLNNNTMRAQTHA